MIGGIGPLEVIVVLVIALVILGPSKLPQAGRSLGRGLRDFKRGLSAVESDVSGEPGDAQQVTAG